MTAQLTRRSFTATALASLALGGSISSARAEEPTESFTYADTISWDAEYDVVVLGMGFAGMAAAISAADNGASVLICEKCPDGEAGGNSRVCGQGFANSHGDAESSYAYYSALTGGRDVPDPVIRMIADGIANIESILADNYGMNRDEFNQFREAEYPEFPGAEGMGFWLTHDGNSDSYLYQSVKERISSIYAEKIDVWFETPGAKLIQDPMSRTVIGVVVDRKGETRNIRALNGVCMCTGGFEADKKMVQDFLGVINNSVIGSLYNTGDGIKMCQEIGARLWHMSVYETLTRQMLGCGYFVPDGSNAISITVSATDSIIMVGPGGKRFGDENYTTRHGHVTDGNGLWENVDYPERIYAIWDQNKMDEIEEEGKLDKDYAGTIVKCSGIAEAAEVIGCETENLQTTIDDFNMFVEAGKDYEFNRAPESMRAFEGDTLYVIPLRNQILNTQGGPERNENAEVLGLDGTPIPNLYSAGEIGAFTACMYQAGSNVAECFITGQLAGANAAIAKGPLPPYSAASKIESSPSHLGDETDLKAVEPPVAQEGELVGTGKGMGGNVSVVLTLDEEGKIASVTVGENSETQGIGSKAIEQLPALFIGLSTAEEIDSIDGVSGATVTSNAIKDAIKNALNL